MYKIVITIYALIAFSDCALNSNPSSNYLTPYQYSVDQNFTECFSSNDGDNIFKYTIENLNSSLPDIRFSDFKGKVIFIINVATFCRSTKDYRQLNQLVEQFGDQLVIVGFPSNNFLNVCFN